MGVPNAVSALRIQDRDRSSKFSTQALESLQSSCRVSLISSCKAIEDSTGAQGGLGIGLSVVNRPVEMHAVNELHGTVCVLHLWIQRPHHGKTLPPAAQ